MGTIGEEARLGVGGRVCKGIRSRALLVKAFQDSQRQRKRHVAVILDDVVGKNLHDP
jgi:hypothetical protein